MFVGFRKTLLKMGKFKIGFGIRLKGGWAICAYLIYAMFYLMWYCFLASLWMIYGVICLMALPVKFIKGKVDRGEWEKAKTLKVCGITFAIMLVIGLIGDLANGTPNSNKSNLTKTNITTSNTISETVATTTIETLEEKKYAEDDLVDRFITEFNDQSVYSMTDISQGNIRTKYHCSTNDCRIEIINATEAAAETFNVSIDGGKNDDGEEKMFSVFTETVKILDSSLTDEQIKNAITEFAEGGKMIEQYSLGDNISITYIPSVELSSGKNNRRIDIAAAYYK